MTSPVFDPTFRATLESLFAWRRDVRRFKQDPVPPEMLDRLLALADLAPSVGNAQPWRFVSVEADESRAAIRANFERCNAEALADYQGSQAALYARLKLEGLDRAPVQLAVFSEEASSQGAGLGRANMPETLAYSVVGAIHTLWLAARAEGIGLGWLSILDPDALTESLRTPTTWRFVAYLCIGWPEEEHLDPELARHGWQTRSDPRQRFLRR
ncbi:MAG: 5,6-dimethylbenzimidazole synthase [Rhodospirillales bacterium]